MNPYTNDGNQLFGGDTQATTPDLAETEPTADLIDGPIVELGPDGTPTGADYFRCHACGLEAMRRRDLREHTCGVDR